MKYLVLLRRNPDFARLWLAQVISLTGDWFTTIVLSALVVRYSPGSEGLAISLLLLSRFVPPMLISPFAGVLVDRFNRQQLLIWSNVLRAGIVLCFLPALYNPDLLWTVYTLSILQFVLSSVFEPGQSALIPNLTRFEDLVEANSLVSITWSVMLALGAILGGVVATQFGPVIALLCNTITYLAAAGFIWSIRGYVYDPRRRQTADRDQPQTGIIDGLRYLRRAPEVASALMVKGGSSIGNVDALMTIFATQLFVLGTDGQLSLGIMYSSFGLGAIVGVLLLNRINDGTVPFMRRLIVIGFIWGLLGWLIMGVAGSLVVVCLGLLVRAMGGSANWTYSTVIIQKTAPDAYLGRVFSLDMMLFYLATVISTFVHGGLVDLVGVANVRYVALGTAIPAMLPLIAWLLILRYLNRRRAVPAAEAAAASD
jgi:MFS family permease